MVTRFTGSQTGFTQGYAFPRFTSILQGLEESYNYGILAISEETESGNIMETAFSSTLEKLPHLDLS